MQPSAPGPRRVVAAVVGAVMACTLGAALATSLGTLHLASACGPGGRLTRMPDGSRACVHSDEPPPGVDVTEHVPTGELRDRVGAGPRAFAAAADLGVPAAVASAATSPEVPCDGDGSSGYRVQPMYVVDAGHANRYDALLPSFRRWAAGVDDVVNRSAAVTGGVRHVRYVTDAGDAGGCVADVLNVTVPVGGTSSFEATVSAVQALGYDDPHRKYLMWTDATSLCGIASLYLSDTTGQDNTNNGFYAQYARVDSGCWGLGNGSSEHSVEAHELTHTLGGVQNSAPHSTKAGHCWDEADTMCYADGGSHAMVSVCSPDHEYLLDCNGDDYFSTYPEPGSYLDSHWNAADSRFLIGGGDGTGGGEPGAPTALGARIAVNNPAVPGLSTQVSVTPSLPAGRSVTSVRWKAARTDCVFATPTEVQSTVSCAASAAGSTTVTAVLTDSTGATKSVSSPLTFVTGTARPVAAALSVAGQGADDLGPGGTASLCAGAASPVSVRLTDVQTGSPIKGLTAAFTRQTTTQTVPAAAGTGTTNGAGVATLTTSSAVPVTFGVATKATAVFAAAGPRTLPAAAERCSPTLTAHASSLDTYTGDPVTVSGTLTRVVAGHDLGVGGASVPVTLTTTTTVSGRTTTKTTTLGSARTADDGSYSLVVKPAASGALAAGLPGSASYAATSAPVGDLAVHVPQSALTAGSAAADLGYGASLTVTGRLDRVAGTSTTGASASTVTAKVTPPGKPAVVLGSARTLADGTFRITAPLRTSGALTVAYAGSAALPAATAALGDVTAGTWRTAVSATAPATASAGQLVKVTGSVTRSYGETSEPARAVQVRLYARPDGATTDTVTVASTTTSGSFAFSVRPTRTTTYTARLVAVPGHADAAAAPLTVTVP